MKTAISVPNELFAKVETQAHNLGMSRSEFFSRAAERYLAELDEDSAVAAINNAVDIAFPSGEAKIVVDHGRSRIAAAAGEW